jgi:hypothetical protein
VKRSAAEVEEVPAGVVTVTSTVPAAPAGRLKTRMANADSTWNEVAWAAPKLTAVAPLKPLPISTTSAPPVVDPEPAEIPVTTGCGG